MTRQLADREFRLRHVADPEADRRRIRPGIADGNARGIAAHERNARGQAAPAQFVEADAQHRAGEVHADYARGRFRVQRRDRQIGRAGAQVEDARLLRQMRLAHRARAPSRVETGAEEVIEEVVASRDRIEHRRDAIGGLVERRSQQPILT